MAIKKPITKAQYRRHTQNLIWGLEEPELRQLCKCKGIYNERADFVVYILIHHWTFPQIAAQLGYSIDTLKDWSPICKRKLGIVHWTP